ncbi:MAG: PAC2 family protein [Deltaproteobacteria bacterium]|nr:PAC2 family protein [Deltaproteobacteria bacterium]
MDEIIYHEIPSLNQPYLIAGFEGWPNAAEVSSFSLQHLVETLKAKRFASIPMENLYEMSSNRPAAIIKDGRLMELNFPGNHFYYSKDPSGKDLILFSGIEPHLGWDIFTDLFLDLAQRFAVHQLFTLGGTYDYIPHTRPTVVSAVFNQEGLKDEIIEAGLNLTEYVGPISIHTFLLEAAGKRGLKAVSLWGHTPQYLQARNIKVVYGVLKKLNDLMRTEMDLSMLESASDYFDQQVNELVNQDPKLREMISNLEEAYQKSGRPSPFGKREESKEDKVVYIQAFLKRQEDEEKKEN